MDEARSRGRIIAETPADANCFIGFHDIIPWSHDGSCIAIHRAAPEFFAMGDCDKPIDICLWRPQTDELQAVDSTNAWNFQQGRACNGCQAGQTRSPLTPLRMAVLYRCLETS